jgi:hypothetical protein
MNASCELFRRTMILVAVFACLTIVTNSSAQTLARGDEHRYAAEKTGAADTITIVTVGNRARLCTKPNAGENGTLARIKTGTKLKVLDTTSVKLPAWSVTWYKVTYKGKTG